MSASTQPRLAIPPIGSAVRTSLLIAVFALACILPAHASATATCKSAGVDPTAAQYCSPTQVPPAEEAAGESEGVHAAGGSGGSPSPPSGYEAPESSAQGVAAASASGSLPFTGADLLALVAVAAALLAVGIAFSRLSRAKADVL